MRGAHGADNYTLLQSTIACDLQDDNTNNFKPVTIGLL